MKAEQQLAAVVALQRGRTTTSGHATCSGPDPWSRGFGKMELFCIGYSTSPGSGNPGDRPRQRFAKDVRAELSSEPGRHDAYTRQYLGWGVFALMMR